MRNLQFSIYNLQMNFQLLNLKIEVLLDFEN